MTLDGLEIPSHDQADTFSSYFKNKITLDLIVIWELIYNGKRNVYYNEFNATDLRKHRRMF
jgi:hypothetical protein